MTPGFDIRALGADDYAHWAPLWREYLSFYAADVSDEIAQTTFQRYADPDRPDMNAWLAWQGDTAVGLVNTIAHPHGWRIEDVIYLQDLFTAAPARGKGVARALIETVYAHADARGTPSVYWMTQTGNATARILYDKIAQATDFMKYSRS